MRITLLLALAAAAQYPELQKYLVKPEDDDDFQMDKLTPPASISPQYAMKADSSGYEYRSYQNDNLPAYAAYDEYPKTDEQRNGPCWHCEDRYEEFEISRFGLSASSLGLLLILMAEVREICPSILQQFFLFLIGLPSSFLFGFELIFPLLIALIGFHDKHKMEDPNGFRVFLGLEGASFVLALTKVIGLFSPMAIDGGVVNELCTWEGATLFESPRWIACGLVPSILLMLLPLIKFAVHRWGIKLGLLGASDY